MEFKFTHNLGEEGPAIHEGFKNFIQNTWSNSKVAFKNYNQHLYENQKKIGESSIPKRYEDFMSPEQQKI